MIIDKREMIGTVHLIIGREYKSSSIKIWKEKKLWEKRKIIKPWKQLLTLFNISYIALYHLNIAMVRGIPDINIINYFSGIWQVFKRSQ